MPTDDPQTQRQSQRIQQALELFKEIKALDIETTDPDVVIEKCESAIKLFGESEAEKIVELRRIKQSAEARKAPPNFRALLERGQKAILDFIFIKILRKLPKWVTITLSIVICVTTALYGLRDYIPRPFYFEFSPDCRLPIESPNESVIDHSCGIEGKKSRDRAQQTENRAKNNFCAGSKHAPDGTFQRLGARDITRRQLVDPQALDRSTREMAPASLQEGEYVSYLAFVKEALNSDTATGEAVNCYLPGKDANDIRIVLVEDPADDECLSTIAEISPHFRPLSWTVENLLNPIIKEHPVRVKGQLFFDGSRKTCDQDPSARPKRASLWEIHPVYSLEVCEGTTLTECQGANAQWQSLEKRFSSGED